MIFFLGMIDVSILTTGQSEGIRKRRFAVKNTLKDIIGSKGKVNTINYQKTWNDLKEHSDLVRHYTILWSDFYIMQSHLYFWSELFSWCSTCVMNPYRKSSRLWPLLRKVNLKTFCIFFSDDYSRYVWRCFERFVRWKYHHTHWSSHYQGQSPELIIITIGLNRCCI